MARALRRPVSPEAAPFARAKGGVAGRCCRCRAQLPELDGVHPKLLPSMQKLSELCEQIGATTKKTEKVALVAEYFRTREADDAAIAAVFLAGRAFAAFDERTLQIG